MQAPKSPAHGWALPWALAPLLISGLVACGEDEPATDTGTPRPDAGPADSGRPDGGAPDGGEMDAGAPDAGEMPKFSIHYHRPDRSYEGWSVVVAGDVETPGTLALTETDGFGAVFSVEPSEGASSLSFQFTDGTTLEPAEPMTVGLSGADGIWWFHEAEIEALTTAPPAIPGENQVAIYYIRPDATYEGWGLHLWGDVVSETPWIAPAQFDGVHPILGAHELVDVQPDGDRVNLIVHMGDTKDPGPDMGFDISVSGDIVFIRSGSADIYTTPQVIPPFQIEGMSAHWVSADLILYNAPEDASTVELRYALDASIRPTDDLDVEGGEVVELTASSDELPGPIAQKFPHLATRGRFIVDASALDQVRSIARAQLVVVARGEDGMPIAATRVQIPGALDDLFTYTGPLGLSFAGQVPTLRLWAPTAHSVRLIRYDEATEVEKATMNFDDQTGVWSLEGEASWYGQQYRFEVSVYHPATDKVEQFVVTDPYSVSLSVNSAYSQILDLENDPALKPAGWDTLAIPPLRAEEDVTIYEAHIRDFSVFDATVPADHRGKYLAFTHDGQGGRALSDGMSHLRDLAQSGLSVFHLLPSFDIATVDERADKRVEVSDSFERLCMLNSDIPMATCVEHGSLPIAQVLDRLDPTSTDAQEIATWMASLDGFNWGYDPYHYTVPEGSYATDPDGPTRILEFRQMVSSLAGYGLRAALDVVYNHTNASGPAEKSVLDKVVPGYYHRLNPETGAVERSTCCDNTASEHAMMEKLMVDSLVTWARDYKIGAFRFDLMGHHMVRNMLAAKEALFPIDPNIYLYGEGWNFGEVQDGRRGPNAIQANMAGTGIGTFNDRLRDAVRGGGPFDAAAALRQTQGFATGLYHAPNELNAGDTSEQAKLNELTDLVRLGMAGNLKDFRMVNRLGTAVRGISIPYNGSPAGYTDDPQESVNYVSKHDNQTLFDIGAYKLATATPMAERVRRQNLAVATTVLGQGIPFLHMGVDLLRSKSMERDSYNSGDWFNRVDWTRSTNNWNVGLPNAEKDMGNYATIGPILADTAIAPTTAHITAAAEHLKELLQLRRSTVLLRLRTKAQVMSRVDYLNVGPDQVPGLIVQSISDGACAGEDLDPNRDGIVVVVNGTPNEQIFDIDYAGLQPHALHASSADSVLRGASVSGNELRVPPLTTAVFELPQSGAQGAGLPCNAR